MNSDPPLVYDDNDSRGSTLDMLHVEDEEEENTDSLEADDGSGDGGGHDPQKSSRDECMDRLKSGGHSGNFRLKVRH